jgi:hypothetical protein
MSLESRHLAFGATRASCGAVSTAGLARRVRNANINHLVSSEPDALHRSRVDDALAIRSDMSSIRIAMATTHCRDISRPPLSDHSTNRGFFAPRLLDWLHDLPPILGVMRESSLSNLGRQSPTNHFLKSRQSLSLFGLRTCPTRRGIGHLRFGIQGRAPYRQRAPRQLSPFDTPRILGMFLTRCYSLLTQRAPRLRR